MRHERGMNATRKSLLVIIGMVLIGASLRGSFTGVAPLIDVIKSSFGLDGFQAGLITAIPVFAFAVISPFAGKISGKYGLELALFLAITLIILGIAIRSAGLMWAFYAGTVVVGAGIAIAQVLLPSLGKRDYPNNVPSITATWVLAAGAGGALASISVIPLSRWFGWQIAALVLVIFPLSAWLVWLGRLRGRSTVRNEASQGMSGDIRIWRSLLAWQITAFMACNSIIFYTMVNWLPSILISKGISESLAASLHGEMLLATAIPALFFGPVINRMRDQRLIAASTGVLMAVGVAGINYFDGFMSIWVLCLGFGSGGGILLAWIFMGLRTNDSLEAARLSGMAQCLGYALAAFGPVLAGQCRDLAGGWSLVLLAGALLGLLMAVFGIFSGRDITLSH